MTITRRDFLRWAGVCGGSALTAGRGNAEPSAAALPPPELSGISHVVVVMMENRSFDHLLGWLPTADGRQAGLSYEDSAGQQHDTYALAPDFTGCGHPDPDHSYNGGRIEYAGGAMDGFLRADQDEYAIGYYEEADRPFFSALARHYTTLDRSFCSILGPTFPNRMFLHAAQTDRLTNTLTVSALPTIWDRLAEAGVSGRYYYANVPFLALWGTRYQSISRSYTQFLIDAATGALPAVSFIDPRYTLLDTGLGNDDHPHADVRAGDAFLSHTFRAVARGPAWPSTVFIVTYDEWGGFFDHVPPPRAAAPNAVDPDLVDGKALLGLRIPTVIASPFTRGFAALPRVRHDVFDHTSILKLIEWRWSLDPLTARDGSSDVGNLAAALVFDRPAVRIPPLPVVSPPPVQACFGNGLDRSEWLELARSGLLDGWTRATIPPQGAI